MKKLSLSDLRSQLAELKRQEAVAQTREQLLVEEKAKLLAEIEILLSDLTKTGLFSEEELLPSNLAGLVAKLHSYIETEVNACKIPPALL